MVGNHNSELLVTRVIKSMAEYVYGVNPNFHVGGHIAYCDPCKAIVLVSDNYQRHVGRNMSKPKREQCFHCDGIDFVAISYRNLTDLRGKYGEKTPNVIINGIEAGLRKIKPINSGYTVYGKDFTKTFESWFALSQTEKINQILTLFQKTDELAKAEEVSEEAMEKVRSLEEAL